MASHIIKLLLLFPLICSAEEIDPPTEEQLIYEETVNHRLNQLYYLSEIAKELKLIRCQIDYTEDCDPDEEE